MLGHLLFALKMLAVTIVVIFLMQIRVGSSSIEDRAFALIHNSPLTGYLHQVAHGGAKLWNDGVAKISGHHHAHDHRARR